MVSVIVTIRTKLPFWISEFHTIPVVVWDPQVDEKKTQAMIILL